MNGGSPNNTYFAQSGLNNASTGDYLTTYRRSTNTRLTVTFMQ